MRAAARQQLDPTIRSNETHDFHQALRAKIVGQEEGVQALVDLYQVFCARLNSPGRPVGNLLFLGPTGSGKTRVVEAMAECLFGDSRALIKLGLGPNYSDKDMYKSTSAAATGPSSTSTRQ